MSVVRLLTALLLIGASFAETTVSPQSQSTLHPDDNLIPSTSTATSITNNQTDAKLVLPEPVNIATAVHVDENASQGVVPRVEIDYDGIPVVHGVVMPDDPNDKKIWRNARVLNNVLIDQSAANDTNPSRAIDDQGDMFVYRPESPRILSDENFQPSPSDRTAFSPSLPYPAFYYQRFYQDNKGAGQPELPDSLAVETDAGANDATTTQASVDDTDARGFNAKKKKTGITKLTPGSSYSATNYQTGQPISYYVQPDEAKAIHDDHSPYDYEPAQQQPTSYYSNDYSTQTPTSKVDYSYYHQQQQQKLQQQQALQQQQLLYQQQVQQQQANPQRTGFYQQNSFVSGNVVPAPADSFVIRDQTYSSGGQTFSVPIPIPKDQYVQQYGQQQNYQYAQQPQYQQYSQPQYAQQFYQQQSPVQQPLEFLSTKLKEQVQKARDKFHDMTDPVVDPLMEAGQKISYNLGLPDRVTKINEKVATPGVLVPLAMVGGAALALGGLGTAIHLSNPDNKHNVFKTFKIDNSTLAERIQMALHPVSNANNNSTRTKRSFDDEDDAQSTDDVTKENLVDHVLSGLNGPQKSFLAQLQQTGFDEWQKTPCAKRIFCNVMVQQNDDAITLMEKRMSTFLSLLDSGVARNLQALTSDVMDGIRRRDCRAFVCGNGQTDSPSEQVAAQ